MIIFQQQKCEVPLDTIMILKDPQKGEVVSKHVRTIPNNWSCQLKNPETSALICLCVFNYIS